MILLNYIFIDKKKDHTGIEPVTYRSAVDCSTTELIARDTSSYLYSLFKPKSYYYCINFKQISLVTSLLYI